MGGRRLSGDEQAARNATATFVIGSDATQSALKNYFAALPLHYQGKAITNIYLRVLRKVQNEIRGNIRNQFVEMSQGRMEKGILVRYLKPRGKSKDPAAMVFVSNSYKHSDVYSIKTHRVVKGVAARYTYGWEYGSAMRKKKSGAETGRLPKTPFFRPAIDKWRPLAEQEVLRELAKSGMKEMEKQAKLFNAKGGTIKITL